jgi:membrane-associated phospholipid phosphatase
MVQNVTITTHDEFRLENVTTINSLYSENRPPPVCETSFGYPSGHCLTTMALFSYMALDYILTRKEDFE